MELERGLGCALQPELGKGARAGEEGQEGAQALGVWHTEYGQKVITLAEKQ